MPQLSIYEAGDSAYANHLTNLLWALLFGPKKGGKFMRVRQSTVLPGKTFDETAAYKQIAGDAGWLYSVSAKSYESVTGFGTHKIKMAGIQMHANKRLCPGIDTTHFQAEPDICDESNTDYDVHVYKSTDGGASFTEITSGWTVDNLTGIIEFDSAQTDDIYWSGYYYSYGAYYRKGDYTQFYDKYGEMSGYKLLPVKNSNFELWGSSTDLSGWTVEGDVTREDSSVLQGNYDCRIGSAGTAFNYIEQTIDLGLETIDRCVLAVTLRATANAYVQVKMGSGDFETCPFLASADQIDRWVTLIVASEQSTQSEITVKITPQLLQAEVGTIYVGQVLLLAGGLL